MPGFNAPVIIRNQRGGYGYATTDLAAIRHRVSTLRTDRIIYVVGAPQTFHFEQVFAVARAAGYLPEDVTAEHVGFGQVLGADGKKFSTREGTAVPLNVLLDMAEAEAAPNVALAAIKYADLSSGLQKDYAFDAERMVQTQGDTGPYLQYAHARVTQILRKAEAEGIHYGSVTVLDEPAEQTLALLLSGFGDVVDEVAHSLQPHKLCGYLYDLAGALASFYEACPVLKSEGDVRASRLALCAATTSRPSPAASTSWGSTLPNACDQLVAGRIHRFPDLSCAYGEIGRENDDSTRPQCRGSGFSKASLAANAAPMIPARLRRLAGTIGVWRSSSGPNFVPVTDTPPPTTNRSGENSISTWE